jgi:hypothetical protein
MTLTASSMPAWEISCVSGRTVGYEKWAKKFNRKEAARTVILLKEKGLGNYDDLTAHIENLSARFDALSDSIKVAEKRMVEVQALQQHIKNYRNTRQIYIEYRKSGYSKKFFEEHRQEITIHKAAKQAFDELQITKLPSMQSLYEEFHQLAVQKKQDYAEYRQIRKEKEELLIAKRTVETILNIDRQKEQEKEELPLKQKATVCTPQRVRIVAAFLLFDFGAFNHGQIFILLFFEKRLKIV